MIINKRRDDSTTTTGVWQKEGTIRLETNKGVAEQVVLGRKPRKGKTTSPKASKKKVTVSRSGLRDRKEENFSVG